ncbi:MAG: DUF4743 domain-containing protein [Gammaproteobacteria bacterium]|nr:DUF4743 domain-containing protein [Gammaproteobacteria bacterium]
MSLLERVREVNRHLPGRKYYRLYVNNMGVGFVDTQIINDLCPLIFSITHTKKRVDIKFETSQRQQLEENIEQFFKDYFAKNHIGGWRNERYAVAAKHSDECMFLVERAALSYLGITGYGVHINGYIQSDNGLCMWIAKRSLSKPTSPGKLDQVAAGGQPHGINLWDNMLKECEEEASIPSEIASQAKPVSALSYWHDLDIGVRPDVIFNYDLELPQSFIPHINDDEVESFQLMHMNDVLERLTHTQDFKFNSAVVIIDFAIRHGLITPEHPDYLALQENMHQRWHMIKEISSEI